MILNAKFNFHFKSTTCNSIENRIRKHVNENVIVVSANVNYPKCKRDYSWNPSTLFVRIASISKVLQIL